MIRIVVIVLSVLYVAAMVWGVRRFKSGLFPHPQVDGDAPARTSSLLAKGIRRGIDISLVLALLGVCAVPPIVLVMALSQIGNPQWGADVDLYSGFQIDIGALHHVDAAGLRDPVIRGQANLMIDTSNRVAWYLFVVLLEAAGIATVFVLIQLRALFVALVNNQPFNAENPARLKKIGLAVMGWNVAAPVLDYFGGSAVLRDISFSSPGIQLYPAMQINVTALFIGLALLVLASVLREAAAMNDERQLTI